MSHVHGPGEPIPKREVEEVVEELVELIIELVDLEVYAKRGEQPPRAKRYRFRVDDHHYETEKPELTGAEILQFAGKTPKQYHLRQRLHGGQVVPIKADEAVDLRKPGLERFMTIPCENTDGESQVTPAPVCPRREVMLPEDDQDFLDANFPGWETVIDGAMPYLILKQFPVPEGYNHTVVQAAIHITSGYPNAPLDMVYFSPDLACNSGRPITALAVQTILGQPWQRWSRHYGWRAGVDNLILHIERIRTWLDLELGR